MSLDLSGLKILVVEDEEHNWFLIREIIAGCHGNPIWVQSGMEAIDYVEKYPDLNLVLMDINLPFMDGLETSSILKRKKPQLPIIAQTAHAMPEHKQKCLESGCDAYIPKPFSIAELQIAIKTILKL